MEPEPRTPTSDLGTDPINIAHIRVAGIGGLGLVAMAGVVAWNVQAIGLATLVAIVAGVILAVALIAWRRRSI
jgi:hypothetical protein